jgi:hypothetical protein
MHARMPHPAVARHGPAPQRHRAARRLRGSGVARRARATRLARNAATWQVTVFILGTGEADVNAQDAAKQATR